MEGSLKGDEVVEGGEEGEGGMGDLQAGSTEDGRAVGSEDAVDATCALGPTGSRRQLGLGQLGSFSLGVELLEGRQRVRAELLDGVDPLLGRHRSELPGVVPAEHLDQPTPAVALAACQVGGTGPPSTQRGDAVGSPAEAATEGAAAIEEGLTLTQTEVGTGVVGVREGSLTVLLIVLDDGADLVGHAVTEGALVLQSEAAVVLQSEAGEVFGFQGLLLVVTVIGGVVHDRTSDGDARAEHGAVERDGGDAEALTSVLADSDDSGASEDPDDGAGEGHPADDGDDLGHLQVQKLPADDGDLLDEVLCLGGDVGVTERADQPRQGELASADHAPDERERVVQCESAVVVERQGAVVVERQGAVVLLSELVLGPVVGRGALLGAAGVAAHRASIFVLRPDGRVLALGLLLLVRRRELLHGEAAALVGLDELDPGVGLGSLLACTATLGLGADDRVARQHRVGEALDDQGAGALGLAGLVGVLPASVLAPPLRHGRGGVVVAELGLAAEASLVVG
ncbi:hypothetical protein CMI37_18790, partial [Candidatus Pacearchaeota archaeon]|nr:hypothetical protein [Candidatus Pacearchaeota archaeon]